MQVDFEGLVAHSEAMRRRREEREARRRVLLQQRVQDVRKEIAGVFTRSCYILAYTPVCCCRAGMKCEIEVCLKQMESCFNLLLPRFIDNTDSSEKGITTDGNGPVRGTARQQTGSSSFGSPGTEDEAKEGSVSGGEGAGCADGTDVDCVNEACSSSSLKGGPCAHGSCKEQRSRSGSCVRRDKGKGKAVVGEPVSH